MGTELVFSKMIGDGSRANNIKKIVDSKGNLYLLSSEVSSSSALSLEFKGFIRVRKYNTKGELISISSKLLEATDPEKHKPALPTGIVVDNEENVYITGYIENVVKGGLIPSDILPIVPLDSTIQTKRLEKGYGFVMKLNKELDKILYSTYLGGVSNDKDSVNKITKALDIGVDSEGCAWVTGLTNSNEFNLTENAKRNRFGNGVYRGFLSCINPCGTELVYSSYFGSEASDFPIGLKIDKDDNIFVIGETEYKYDGDWDTAVKGKFPIVNAYQAVLPPKANGIGFICKFNTDGDILYSSYLGGEIGESCTTNLILDKDSSIYVAGFTAGGFPIKNGYIKETTNYSKVAFTGFVCKLDATGKELIASTYMGKGNDFRAIQGMPAIIYYTDENLLFNSATGVTKGLYIDNAGNVYVAGESLSNIYPVTIETAYQESRNRDSDCVVTKLSGDLSELLYSTYIGGTARDTVNSIYVDADGYIYIVGQTASLDYPITEGGIGRGDRNGFFTKMDITAVPKVLSTSILDRNYKVEEITKEYDVNDIVKKQNWRIIKE